MGSNKPTLRQSLHCCSKRSLCRCPSGFDRCLSVLARCLARKPLPDAASSTRHTCALSSQAHCHSVGGYMLHSTSISWSPALSDACVTSVISEILPDLVGRQCNGRQKQTNGASLFSCNMQAFAGSSTSRTTERRAPDQYKQLQLSTQNASDRQKDQHAIRLHLWPSALQLWPLAAMRVSIQKL